MGSPVIRVGLVLGKLSRSDSTVDVMIEVGGIGGTPWWGGVYTLELTMSEKLMW